MFCVSRVLCVLCFPKFGGPGKKKKCCEQRKCNALVLERL